MRWLVGLCVRYAGTLATLTLVALLAGLWATRSAPLDVFPDFVPSTVDIQTEAPGFPAPAVQAAGNKADRKCRQRRARPCHPALGIHSGPVAGHHSVPRQYRSLQCAAGHFRALERV